MPKFCVWCCTDHMKHARPLSLGLVLLCLALSAVPLTSPWRNTCCHPCVGSRAVVGRLSWCPPLTSSNSWMMRRLTLRLRNQDSLSLSRACLPLRCLSLQVLTAFGTQLWVVERCFWHHRLSLLSSGWMPWMMHTVWSWAFYLFKMLPLKCLRWLTPWLHVRVSIHHLRHRLSSRRLLDQLSCWLHFKHAHVHWLCTCHQEW